MEEFYMTLMSNSSMDIYPDNKTSSFIVHLPKRLRLNGEWAVAVAEFHFPFTLLNVNEDSNTIYEKNNVFVEDDHADDEINPSYNVTKIFSIDPGNYDSMDDVVAKINEKFLEEADGEIENLTKFEIDPITKHLKIHRSEYSDVVTEKKIKNKKFQRFIVADSVILEKRLALQCGFIPEENIFKYKQSPNVVSLNLGIPHEIMIYCDIIQPQYIGHTYSQVLKIVNVLNNQKTEFGDLITRDFPHRNYLPLLIKDFSTVAIDLRTSTGEFMPFRFGTATVILHFIKTKN